MPEIQAKGLNFASVLRALEALRGHDFLAHAIEAMPPESGSAIQHGSVIASGWYPIRWYRELVDAAVELSRDQGLPQEIGRVSFQAEIKGVHRLLFRVMSVETLQAQGARFFKAYFRPTKVTVERIEPGVARTHYQQCFGFNRNLWQEQVGGVRELLRQSGIAQPRMRILAGGNDADSAMDLEVCWR